MKRWLIVIVILAVGATVAGAYLYTETERTTPRYRVARVERGVITATVAASGMLNPVITVQVGSQLSGQVREIFVDFNSKVSRGQKVALIAPETFESKVHQAEADLRNAEASVLTQRALVQRAQADLENARATLAVAQAQTAKAQVAVVDARRDFDRKHALSEKQLIALSDRDSAQAVHDSAVAQADSVRAQERVLSAAITSAEAQLEAARAQLQSAVATVEQRKASLAQAQVDLDNTVIRAPVDGIVVSRSIDVGQTVAASLQSPTLFTIAQDLSRMQVETNILEADIGRVRVGQSATFTVDAFPSKTFSGQVVQIRRAPQVTQGVVSYNVVVSAQNPELRLLPGMTANVKIITAQKTAVLKIPNAALRVRVPEAEGAGSGDGTERRESKNAAKADDKASARPAVHDGGEGQKGRVYVLTAAGAPKSIVTRLGLTDGNATELLGDELTEGQSVVVAVDRQPAKGRARSAQVRL
jgi:HlyD family secretion protein